MTRDVGALAIHCRHHTMNTIVLGELQMHIVRRDFIRLIVSHEIAD